MDAVQQAPHLFGEPSFTLSNEKVPDTVFDQSSDKQVCAYSDERQKELNHSIRSDDILFRQVLKTQSPKLPSKGLCVQIPCRLRFSRFSNAVVRSAWDGVTIRPSGAQSKATLCALSKDRPQSAPCGSWGKYAMKRLSSTMVEKKYSKISSASLVAETPSSVSNNLGQTQCSNNDQAQPRVPMPIPPTGDEVEEKTSLINDSTIDLREILYPQYVKAERMLMAEHRALEQVYDILVELRSAAIAESCASATFDRNAEVPEQEGVVKASNVIPLKCKSNAFFL